MNGEVWSIGLLECVKIQSKPFVCYGRNTDSTGPKPEKNCQNRIKNRKTNTTPT